MSAKCKLFLLFFPFLFFIRPSSVSAQVVINEFSVVPPDKQDWVELYSPESINISGWMIGDEAGVFKTVTEDKILGPGIYYIITKYQRLNNDKDTIFLYDPNSNIIDSIKYGYEGEVCVPGPNGSIARIPDGSNLYDRLSVHTKDQPNGGVITDPCPTPTPTPTPTPQPTSTPRPTSTSEPTPTIKKTPTPKPTIKAVASRKVIPTKSSVAIKPGEEPDEVILGLRNQLTITPTESPGEENNGKFPLLAILMIIGGISFMGAAGYPFVKDKIKRYNASSEKIS